MKYPSYFQGLSSNVRFYVLAASLLASIIVVSAFRLTIPSDQLFSIRTQQAYGLLSVVMLYIATILTPLSKLFAKPRPAWLEVLLFSRRAIGVSAAYFAVLHTGIVLFDQVGGLSGLFLLPPRFVVAFALGALALLVLLVMAATSFDTVIARLTFPRWKRLHRFIYPAVVLVIVHVWLIGTHAALLSTRLTVMIAIDVLAALEALRIARFATTKYKLNMESQAAIFLLVFGLMIGALYALPLVVRNYNTEHQTQHEQHL